MECYYDVYAGQYVYYNGFEWLHSPYAPPAYAGYDMYNGSVVVLNYGTNDPWLNHTTYVITYPRGSYGNNTVAGPRGGANTVSPTGNNHQRGFDENSKVILYGKESQKNNPAIINSTPKPPDKSPVLQNQMGTPQKSNNEPHPVLIPEPVKHRQVNEEGQPVKKPSGEMKEPNQVHHTNPIPNPSKTEHEENQPLKINKPVPEKGQRNPAAPQNSKKNVKGNNGGY
jgi:hypothetical protein